MTQPVSPIILAPVENWSQEREWLQATLLRWLDAEYLPESANQAIAQQAAQAYIRQRMEGEDSLDGVNLAVLAEMQGFDFSQSFYGEFAIANIVSEILMDRMGIEPCCGLIRPI